MKKILPFVLFLLMSVTAMAGNSYEFEETYRYQGDVTSKGDGLATVVITDNEDGTYTIAISGMQCYVDLGTITFKNIPGKETRGITRFSSDMEFVEGEVVNSGFNRGETKMTVEGAFKKDECYVELAGKFQGWSDNPFQIWIGSPVEPDAFVYKVKAEITYGDDTVTHDADEVRIIDNGDGTITLTIQPKQEELAFRGEGPQGSFFEVLGDITGAVSSIGALSFTEGGANENVKVMYKGGTGSVTINTKTKEIVSAHYTMIANVDVTHACIAIIKDKSASVKITYTNEYPASDKYLKDRRGITRL